MAFTGGPLNVIGITPSFISQVGTQAATVGVQQGLSQVWQGAGQSFLGSAAQSLVGNLAGSAVNVALNSVLGTQVAGPQGLTLTSGANLLASSITPYITGAVAAGINQNIQKSLQSAGPFGPVLSTIGTGLANQALGGITNAIFGGGAGTGPGFASQSSGFKGLHGGDEPAADYGGSSYSLGEVIFSLQPANQGPQAFGFSQALNDPKSVTTLPFNDLASMKPLAPNATANALKGAAMSNEVGTKAFSSNLAGNFNTSGNFL